MNVIIELDEKIVDSINNIVKVTKNHPNEILSKALILYVEEYKKQLEIERKKLIKQKREEIRLSRN